MDQTNLVDNIVKFNNKSEPKTKESKDQKLNTFDSVNALYEGQELTLNAFRSRICPIKATKGEGRPHILALHPSNLARIAPVAKVSDCKVFDRKRLKILTPKQMYQRLPIALAQLKAGNTSENLLN